MGLLSSVRSRITRRFTPPPGATVMPYDGKLMAQMQMASGPQKEQASAFSPGPPIPPTPGVTLPSGPRQWAFPIGYNIGLLPRATEATSFDTLRNLASLYDGVLLCEQVWFDYISKLELDIQPTKAALAGAGGDETVFQQDIARYTAFFERPDPGNDLDLHSWLNMAVREQLELDALACYVRPTRGGGVYSLEILDGSTIKPLIDDRGRKPLPPYPAYQQFWYGAPLGLYSRDEIIYHRETQRADSAYGLSRVERIILRVNQALRKQNKDMSYFTEGNLPLGILKMPETDTNEWTPDQVLAFQRVWDGLLAGNDKMRSRLKVVPPGGEYQAIESNDDLLTKFDSFLLNITVACYGLTMAELGFTENVNKSSGDSQENVVYRRAMRPLMRRYENLFTQILRRYFRESRFVVKFRGFEESEDIGQLATAYSTLTTAGILGLSDAGTLLKLPHQPDQPYIGRVIVTKDGPIFLDTMADPAIQDAQAQAKLAGLKNAAQNPGAQPTDASKSAHDEPKPAKSEPKSPNPEKSGEDDEDAGRAISAEYRRWRERALSDVKAGRAQRGFTTTLIPEHVQRAVTTQLAGCETAEDVKAVFRATKDGAPDSGDWQQGDPAIAAALNAYRDQGVIETGWNASTGACDQCLRNAGQRRKLGLPYPTGAYLAQQHPHCECTMTLYYANGQQHEAMPVTVGAS